MPEARMRMYLINLTQDVARWRSVSSQFATVGLQARRLEAVQGAGLTSADTLGLYSATLNAAQYHKPLLAGEIGCYASHLSAWQQLLDSKEALMAVFEDDIEIDIDLPQVLEAVARLGESWDIVKLIGRSQEKTAERIPFLRGRDLVSYRRVPSLTGAYVITARGAEKLLRRRRPFGRPVDVDMRYWWECDVRVLGVHPYPVRGAPSSRDSTIEDRAGDGDAAGRLKKLALQLRYTILNALSRYAQRPLRARRAVSPENAEVGRDAA